MGGKSKQSKWIAGHFPERYDTYIEVFGGAFWVYLNTDLQSKQIIYNDIDPMMYNLWLCIKEYDKLIPILESMKPNQKDFFIECRSIIKEYMKNPVDIREADFDVVKPFVYWLTHSFSGDINGGMSKKNNHIPTLNRLKKDKIRKKIDKIEVYNLSYDEIIPKFDKEDTLFYIDPPYYGREHFYGFHQFTVKDHEKLANIIKKMKGYAVVSYYRLPEIESLYPENEYIYEEKEYKRSSSSVKKGSKKNKTTELLIINRKEKSILF